MKNQVSNLDKLTLSNDFLFKHVMLRKRICKHILEELLHTKIADITYLEAEQTLDVYPDSHGIRLDVRIADDTNTHYNLEMQVKNPVSRTGASSDTAFFENHRSTICFLRSSDSNLLVSHPDGQLY